MRFSNKDYKDKLVEFDYLTTKSKKHIKGYVRIEDNYNTNDCLIDIEISPHWICEFDKKSIINFVVSKENSKNYFNLLYLSTGAKLSEIDTIVIDEKEYKLPKTVSIYETKDQYQKDSYSIALQVIAQLLGEEK